MNEWRMRCKCLFFFLFSALFFVLMRMMNRINKEFPTKTGNGVDKGVVW